MSRRARFLNVLVLPLLVAGLAVLVLSRTTATMQEPPDWAAPCSTGTDKSVDPSSVYLGDTAQVTLVMTGTCPSIDLPMDIVFVVDRSNSMTKGSGSVIDPGGPGITTPGPIAPTSGPVDPFPTQKQPPPTKDPGPVPPTALWSTAYAGKLVPGVAQGPIEPPPTPKGTTGPNPTKTPLVKDTPPAIVPTGGPIVDPTRSLIVRDQEEAAGTEDLIAVVREAVLAFLDHEEQAINDGRIRVALVTFNDRARIDVDLSRSTNGASRVRSALSRVQGGGNTRIDLGYSAAQRVLYGVTYRGRTDLDYKKVSILFSDGLADPRTTARLRMRNDITYMTAAAGRAADTRVMRNLASENEFALDVRDREELVHRVEGLPVKTRAVTLTTVTIADKLQPDMELVPGSANPPVTRVQPDGTLEWDFLDPTGPMTVTYDVKPLQAGVLPVSEMAEGRWQDSETRAGTVPFPNVDLEVLTVPTPTPGPSATPEIEDTATPGPVGPWYLPAALNRYGTETCQPQHQTVDVALVIDTSNSMRDPTQPGGITKVEAATRAGRSFVNLLKPGDQGAIIAFNAQGYVLSPLTGDKTALTTALGQLGTVAAQGTKIDEGLRLALAELLGPAHRAENNRAIVLVTDGRQDDGANAAVVAQADAAKAAGVIVWTVGLGADADHNLLRLLASSASTYVFAPDAESLELIYQDIARLVPCP